VKTSLAASSSWIRRWSRGSRVPRLPIGSFSSFVVTVSP
jgi:hypothetical protein